jgi:hypothetical protein
MKLIPLDQSLIFQVKLHNKEWWDEENRPEKDVIELIYNDYEYALNGTVDQFEEMVKVMVSGIKEEEAA